MFGAENPIIDADSTTAVGRDIQIGVWKFILNSKASVRYALIDELLYCAPTGTPYVRRSATTIMMGRRAACVG